MRQLLQNIRPVQPGSFTARGWQVSKVSRPERSPQASADVSGSRRGRGMADVIVIGGGLIGLASTAALAARRVRVTLIAQRRPGEASPSAAGMLAPGVERTT